MSQHKPEFVRALGRTVSRRQVLKIMGGTMLVPFLGVRGFHSLYQEVLRLPGQQRDPFALPALDSNFDVCATTDSGPEDAIRNGSPQEMAHYRDLASHLSASSNKKTIDVAFHVIPLANGGANVTDAQVAVQMQVINTAYAPCALQFRLVHLDRTVNDNWWEMDPFSGKERQMKKELAIDPAHTLNIYALVPEQGFLGWAWLPWWLKTEDDYLQGIAIHTATIPGVFDSPYDGGTIAVHEIGHYLGLYHTFQGGCAEPGDYCDDTPAEAVHAFYSCAGGVDTCASSGPDPVHNFMDYYTCTNQFTRDQTARMYWALATYHPSLTT